MKASRVLAAVWVASLLAAAPAPAADRVADHATDHAADRAGEWRDYAGDKGASRYSPLDRIDAGNAGDLRVAWRRPAVMPEVVAEDAGIATTGYFSSTPLMVAGRLIAQDAAGFVNAFDPATGETLWVQERFAGDKAKGSGMRSVAFVPGSGSGAGRILAVRDNWLYALDMAGRIVRSFGDGGRVDLTPGLGARAERYNWRGVPQVCGSVVALGAAMTDSPANKEEVPGRVQAFDVNTGRPRWTFNPIPDESDPAAVRTWEDGSWRYSGQANVWTQLSADEKLGLLYLPTSSPTNDMYGGHRLGDNLYSDSIVALNCETGAMRWHRQLVHHDLWDLDLNSAPMLIDIKVKGRPVKALVQLTKWGSAYTFDRATGAPVWPIEERPVPPSTVPGERAAPTQPFPQKPPAYEIQASTPDQLIDLTPELHAEAVELAKAFVTGPIFTPPPIEREGGKRGGLQTTSGGASWAGGAFDPETGALYVPSFTRTIWASIVAGDPAQTNLRYVRGRRSPMVGPQGLPLTKPPFGRITRFDMNKGALDWVIANGDGPRDHPALKGTNPPKLGIPANNIALVTRTLLFVAQMDKATSLGRTPDGKIPLADYFETNLMVYDKASGDLIAKVPLPAGATGAPMTYLHKGRQYVVVPVGSIAKPAEFVAVALP